MHILLIEDDPTRIKLFNRSWGINHTLDVCSDPNALNFKADKYDLIFLDFDLNEEHTVSSLKLVPLIRKLPKCPIVIHSLNPDGAELLKNELQDLFVIYKEPFVWTRLPSELLVKIFP